jgi:hypothetical protein
MAKLKGKIAKLEDVDEPLRALYVKDGESFVLGEYEIEDISGLKTALEKEKTERRTLKAQVEKFKDLDPDKARDALKKLEELDEKQLIDKGEFDRLLKKRTEEYDTKEAEYKRLIDEHSKRLDKYELINPVRDAALKAGVLPTDIDIVLAYTGSRFKLDDKRKPVVVDKDGDVSSTSVEDFWAKEFKTEHAKFYAPTGAAGSGAPNGTHGTNGKKVITRDQWKQMSPQESVAYFKDGGQLTD